MGNDGRIASWDREVHNTAADKIEGAAKCVETLQLLKGASNYSHFASVMVAVDGKPITTIGNLIAEAVGGLDPDPRGQKT